MQSMSSVPEHPTDLRFSNRVQVLRVFLDGTPNSAGDAAARVGLSRQTVMKAIQFFLRTGLLVSGGKGESSSQGGKRPELFELTRERYFVCITMWPNYQHIHLTTVGGIPVADSVREEPLSPDPKEAMSRIGRQAAELVRDSGVDMDHVRAVSVSTAGIMDYAAGTLRYSSQSPQWGMDVPLAQLLRPWFAEDAILFVENTGKMTARPLLLDPELARKRLLVVFSCWGLSGCLLEDGKILSGSNALIGEIGHMVIDPADEALCGCGSRGCLERLVSAERLALLTRQKAAEYPQSPLLTGELTVPRVFACSAEADPLARELVAYLAGCFAVALRSISLVFDPEVVVFQGDYAYADSHFHETLKNCIRRFRYFPPEGPFEIRCDRRELTALDTAGSVIALSGLYFSRPELYTE